MNNNFQEVINKVSSLIDKYKDLDNIELEFRLGLLVDGGSFDSQVPEEFYNNIKKLLDSNKSWIDKNISETTDFFYNGMRMSMDSNGKKECIKKNKICIMDFTFEGTPFDIRICISQEIPISMIEFNPPSKKSLYSRKKKRNTYRYKYWNYDITQVTTIENTLEETIYEIELDITNLKNVIINNNINSKYIVHSGLLKLKDLIDVCEKLDDKALLELFNIKEFN